MEMKRLNKLFDVIIIILTFAGTVFMLTGTPEEAALHATGIENLKFYTVLSNIFCGLTALSELILIALNKETNKFSALKLAALCCVTVTFAVVAFFFGPIYGYIQFYKGGNFIFHLIEPVTAIVGFITVKRSRMPFIYTVIATVPTLLYGFGYMGNLLINGVGGPWPHTNDFYAFLSWGWPAGIAIFTSITALTFGLACIYRAISNRRAVIS